MIDTKNQTIEEKIIFEILEISRLVRKKKEKIANPSALPSLVQFLTLKLIEGKTFSMKDLSENLQITMPSTTSLIERLVKAGSVERQFDENDRRTVLVSLTEKGKQDISCMEKSKSEGFKYILSTLSIEDKENLYKIIHKISKNLILKENSNVTK